MITILLDQRAGDGISHSHKTIFIVPVVDKLFVVCRISLRICVKNLHDPVLVDGASRSTTQKNDPGLR